VLLTMVGRFAEGRSALRRALDSPKVADQKMRVQWIGFLQQCERNAVFDQNLAAYLLGEFKPANVRERLELASFCLQTREQYVVAVRLYEEAFSTDPRFAGPRSPVRYDAAIAAAFAAAGSGKDAPKADEAEQRANLGRKARDWLLADSALLLGNPSPEDAKFRAAILEILQRWRAEPKLAAVRDVDKLKLLPASERVEWNTFWQDVSALAEHLKAGN
jgi:hypothetical protein